MSIKLLPESYSVCFVETITLVSFLWISISGKFGFGPLCQAALVQRLDLYADGNSAAAWEEWKLIYGLLLSYTVIFCFVHERQN